MLTAVCGLTLPEVQGKCFLVDMLIISNYTCPVYLGLQFLMPPLTAWDGGSTCSTVFCLPQAAMLSRSNPVGIGHLWCGRRKTDKLMVI